MDYSQPPGWTPGSPRRRARGRKTTGNERAGRDGHFESIGLPAEAGWYVSAALYWIGGLSVVLIDRFSSVNPTIGLLGALVLAISPWMLVGARFAPDASWGAPVRIIIPSIVLTAGGFFIGDSISALVLLLLFPLLAIAFLHKPRVAIIYSVGAIAVMVGMLLAHGTDDANVTRAIVLAGVAMSLSCGLIYSQDRVRRAAAANHAHSQTDPLTGIANIRALHARLEQEIPRAARDHSEIVMFAIDLDDFKEVNDRFNYELGDAVLKAVAAALEQELEPGDLLVRRGGDEFAVLAMAVPGRHMARFGDRLSATIERTRRAVCPDVNPRASITRVSHRPGESAADYLRRVDDGLHDAKVAAHPERANVFSDPNAAGAASAGQAGAAPVRDDKPRDLHTGTSIAQHRANNSLAWRLAAALSVGTATLIAIVTIGGTADDLRTRQIIACILGMVACAIGSLIAGRFGARRIWLHLPVAATLGLTIAAIALAGPSRPALVELCALAAPLAVVLFGWRSALVYSAVSAVAYGYFLIDSDQSFAVLQTLLFIGIMAVLMVMLERGQRITRGFTEAAEAISAVDPLTGVANLRGYDTRIEHEIARCEARGEGFSVTMIDLERFKAVNDRHSHSTGDQLLIDTADAISAVVREDELVVRRGGDEFAVICASEDAADMETFARRVSEAIFAARMRLTPDIPAGATVETVFWQYGEDAEAIKRRADEALHAAKQRDRGDYSRV